MYPIEALGYEHSPSVVISPYDIDHIKEHSNYLPHQFLEWDKLIEYDTPDSITPPCEPHYPYCQGKSNRILM